MKKIRSRIPMYSLLTGSHANLVRFGSLPVKVGKAKIFYEEHLGRPPGWWINNGVLTPKRGGLPQLLIEREFVDHINETLSGEDFDHGIINFESFTAWDKMAAEHPIRLMSIEWSRARWKNIKDEASLLGRAKEDYTHAMQRLYLLALITCKHAVPGAKWGLYGNPWIEDDPYIEIRDLYTEFTGFYPNIYKVHRGVLTDPGVGESHPDHYIGAMYSRLAYAKLIAPGRTVNVLAWPQYHEMNIRYGHQMLTPQDAHDMAKVAIDGGADTLCWWGNINTPELAEQYSAWFNGAAGRAVANVVQRRVLPRYMKGLHH